jgi:type I restriction enzyme S subunit
MPVVSFDEALVDASGGNKKTPQSTYLERGLLPIVDQSMAHIAGYTDDLAAAYQGELPVIVFGDHTRAVKYIDHPFSMGADGVKVLRARPGWSTKYLYHYLRHVDLPAAGYSRHFKFLKEITVPRPPLVEQDRIVRLLDRGEQLVEMRRRCRSLMYSTIQSLMAEVLRSRSQHPTGWHDAYLSDLVADGDSISYGVVQPGPDVVGGVPMIRAGDLQYGSVRRGELKRISREIEGAYRRTRIVGNEVLLSCVGTIGQVAVVDESVIGSNINRAVARIPINSEKLRLFTADQLQSPLLHGYFVREARTVAQPTLNIREISKAQVAVPPDKLLDSYLRKRVRLTQHSNELTRDEETMGQLIASLQHRAFRGQL